MINLLLKDANLKLKRGAKNLNIRGSLPSKENKNNFKVQRISLGLKADINGLEEAKKKITINKFAIRIKSI